MSIHTIIMSFGTNLIEEKHCSIYNFLCIPSVDKGTPCILLSTEGIGNRER